MKPTDIPRVMSAQSRAVTSEVPPEKTEFDRIASTTWAPASPVIAWPDICHHGIEFERRPALTMHVFLPTAITMKRKTNKAASRRVIEAYHEAGHAAMHWFFKTQDELFGVDMAAGSKDSPQVRQHYKITPAHIADIRPIDPRRAIAATAMVVMRNLAGYCAENRYKQSNVDWLTREFKLEWELCDRPSDTEDIVKAIRAVQALHGQTGRLVRWTTLKRYAKWTTDALMDDGVWGVVEALAQVLMKKHAVGAGETWEIMNSAGGKQQPLPLERPPWNRRFRHLP